MLSRGEGGQAQSEMPTHQGTAAGSLGAWIMASRIPTLAAALAPVAVGTAVAQVSSGARLWPTLAAAWGAIWIQIGTNFANDVYDFEKGADTGERLGPTRAVQAGLLTAEQMRKGMVIAFLLATAGGLALIYFAGWPMLWIGLFSIASGIAYTGGPYPLGYNGLGDLFVMIFFGFVAVCGTAYANLLTVPELAWWASIPPGALATAILVVNNVRDRKTDIEAGKRTLAVRFGRRVALGEYLLLMLAAYAVPIGLAGWRGANAWVLLPLLTLPMAWNTCRGLFKLEGSPLNAVLVATARLLIVFGALFTAGLILGLA